MSFHLVGTLAVKGYVFLCGKEKCHRQVVVVEVTDLIVFGGKIGVDKLGLENKVAVDAVVSAVHVQGERAVRLHLSSQVKYAFACPRSLKYVTYTHNGGGNVKGSVITVGKSLSVYVENNNGVLVLKFRRNFARQFEPSTTKFFICPKVTFFNLFKGVVFQVFIGDRLGTFHALCSEVDGVSVDVAAHSPYVFGEGGVFQHSAKQIFDDFNHIAPSFCVASAPARFAFSVTGMRASTVRGV